MGHACYATAEDELSFALTHIECCFVVGSTYVEHLLG